MTTATAAPTETTIALAPGQAVNERKPVLELTGETTPIPVLLKDLVVHWRLLPVLAKQDFSSRYRSASLGLAWSVFLPLFQGAILAIVFTHVIKVTLPPGAHYPVFVIAGMNTWTYYSTSFTTASTAIVDNSGLASRVYFPRLLCAALPTASGFISYAISNGVLIILTFAFGVGFHWTLLILPIAMLLPLLLATTLAAVLCMMHVYFRDVKYVVTAIMLVWFYATPVIYPVTKLHSHRWIILINPGTGLVQSVRWCVLGTHATYLVDVGLSVFITLAWSLVALAIALVIYRRYERVAVDRL